MISYNMSAFAIPICYGSFGEDSRNLNKQIVEDIDHYINNYDFEKRSGVDVKQSFLGLENIYNSFDILGNLISKYVEKYVEWSGVNTENIIVNNFWANVNTDPYAFHMPHSHDIRKATFSGVYFPSSGILNEISISDTQDLNKDPDVCSKTQPNSGDLVLLDPIEFVKTSIANKNISKYPFFGNPICITPREATIVIFPSYLSHMVTPTKKENFKRISVAFNIEI